MTTLNFPATNPDLGGVVFGSVVIPTNDVADLLAGLAYVNIGTASNATGEIRGQLISLLPTITCPEPMTADCGVSLVPAVTVFDPLRGALTVVWSVDGMTVNQPDIPAGIPPNQGLP